MYFLLTSKKNKTLLPTKSFNEAYDFIVENQDAKVRTLNYTAKAKIIDRRIFLTRFYKSLRSSDETENRIHKERLFQLTEIMVKGKTNFYDFMNLLELTEDYRVYRRDLNKTV